MTLHDVPIHMWFFCPQMTLHDIPRVLAIILFEKWYTPMMTSHDFTKWPTDGLTILVSDNHGTKKIGHLMTSSVRKKRLWIFCPQMTLHSVPKMSQIGVNEQKMIGFESLLKVHTLGNYFFMTRKLGSPLVSSRSKPFRARGITLHVIPQVHLKWMSPLMLLKLIAMGDTVNRNVNQVN